MKLTAEVVVPLIAALLVVPGFYWTFLRGRVETVRRTEIAHSRKKMYVQRDAARTWTIIIGVLLACQMCFGGIVLLGGLDAVLSIGRSSEIDVTRVAALAGCIIAIGGSAILGQECKQTYGIWQSRKKALEGANRTLERDAVTP